MSNLKRDAKRRAVASRKALTPKNIIEHSMQESAKVQQRNRAMQTNALKTNQKLLQTIVFVAPPKPQITTEQNYSA
jgi:hypothetical protein